MIWDAEQRRYEDSNGRALTPAQIRRHIEEFIESEKESIRAESEKLFSRAITVAAFFEFMRQRVTAWHSIAGQIAYGGESQMGRKEWKRVNEKILSELEYLGDFEQAVDNSFGAAEAIGEQVVQGLDVPPELEPSVRDAVADALLQATPSDAESVVNGILSAAGVVSTVAVEAGLASLLIGGTVESRAQMYTDSTYATYENNVLSRERDEGGGEIRGRRVLEAGDNCEDCIAASTEGFVPLSDLPEIGDSVCGPRCRCEFEFETDGDSFRTSELFGGRIGGQEAFGGDVEVS